MVNAARPIKHGRKVWWWWKGRELESWVPHRAALCGLLSCCSVSLVCVWQSNGTRPYKRTSRFLHSSLWMPCSFLVHPPGASQQNTLFQTNSRQMQTLHSIITSGEHSNGIALVRELNLHGEGLRSAGMIEKRKGLKLRSSARGTVGWRTCARTEKGVKEHLRNISRTLAWLFSDVGLI